MLEVKITVKEHKKIKEKYVGKLAASTHFYDVNLYTTESPVTLTVRIRSTSFVYIFNTPKELEDYLDKNIAIKPK